MIPHTSGTSLSAQARYAAGTREILECWFDGRPIRKEYLIVEGGKLAGAGAHSYSEGDATGGSDEAARMTENRLVRRCGAARAPGSCSGHRDRVGTDAFGAAPLRARVQVSGLSVVFLKVTPRPAGAGARREKE
jgi:hypothetical protein